MAFALDTKNGGIDIENKCIICFDDNGDEMLIDATLYNICTTQIRCLQEIWKWHIWSKILEFF